MLEEGLRQVGSLEALYERIARFVEPSELEENPLPMVRAYLATLRSLERCIELRVKLVREAGRLPRPEPEQPLATVDLSRLSDEALREVEEALVPLGAAPAVVSEVPPERNGERDDRIGSCKENNENDKITPAAAALLPEPFPEPGKLAEQAAVPHSPRKTAPAAHCSGNLPGPQTPEGGIPSAPEAMSVLPPEKSPPKRAKAGKPPGTATRGSSSG